MWVGRQDERMVFALPGNPVSSLVCARRYVVPAIHGSMGHTAPDESARLGRPVELNASLTRFVPVTLRRHESGMVAEPQPVNTSGDFRSLAGTTGLLELAPGPGAAPIGQTAPLWRW